MIQTSRLRMGPLAEADVPQMRRIWGDPQVMAFCGGPATEERLRLAVQRCVASQRERGYSPLAVRTRAEGALIGVCGLKGLLDPAGAELIYHFVPEVWGLGYATESVRALLAWAEGNLPLRYVEASFDERNTASRQVLVKAGFAWLEARWYDDVQRTEPVYRFELQTRSSP